jgi:hypothetical protein
VYRIVPCRDSRKSPFPVGGYGDTGSIPITFSWRTLEKDPTVCRTRSSETYSCLQTTGHLGSIVSKYLYTTPRHLGICLSKLMTEKVGLVHDSSLFTACMVLISFASLETPTFWAVPEPATTSVLIVSERIHAWKKTQFSRNSLLLRSAELATVLLELFQNHAYTPFHFERLNDPEFVRLSRDEIPC